MILALDTETFLITRKNPFPKHVCTSIAYKDDSGIQTDLLLHGKDTFEFLQQILLDSEIQIVGHNIAYDMGVIMINYPELTQLIFGAYERNRITDTGIRQQLFDIATAGEYHGGNTAEYHLSQLYEIIFNERAPNWESKVEENPYSWRLRYSELYEIAIERWPKEAIQYAKLDAKITLQIYLEQEKASEYLRDDPFQTYSAFCLALIGNKGIYTDANKVESFIIETQEKYEKLIPELSQYGLIEQDRKNNWVKKQKPTQDRIIKACSAMNRIPFETEKGRIATDKKSIYWSQDPILLKRLQFTECEKLLSTYIPVLVEGLELPIHTRFGLAATGRTTSKAPSKPLVGTNFQNWPRKSQARSCFVPRNNNLFLSADFAGAELHSMAHIQYEMFGVSALGEALKNKDCHLLLAASITNREYEQMWIDYHNGDKETAKYRQFAKIGNFGFLGGMGAETLCDSYLQDTGKVLDLNLSLNIKHAFMMTWLEMKAYFNNTSNTLNEGGGEALIEQYWSKRLRKVTSFCVMNNTYFQGLTGDAAKHAMNCVVRKCYSDQTSVLYGCKPVNFIHDELLLEIPNNEKQESICNELKYTMEIKFNEVCDRSPTTVDLGISDCWKKEAKNPFKNGAYVGFVK